MAGSRWRVLQRRRNGTLEQAQHVAPQHSLITSVLGCYSTGDINAKRILPGNQRAVIRVVAQHQIWRQHRCPPSASLKGRDTCIQQRPIRHAPILAQKAHHAFCCDLPERLSTRTAEQPCGRMKWQASIPWIVFLFRKIDRRGQHQRHKLQLVNEMSQPTALCVSANCRLHWLY